MFISPDINLARAELLHLLGFILTRKLIPSNCTMIAANMPPGVTVPILLGVMVVTTILLASKPALSMPYDRPTSTSTNSSPYPSNGSFTGSKPGCQSQCGNLTIPYPFGISDNCPMYPEFTINCNTSFNPPRALLNGIRRYDSGTDFVDNIEALGISETEIRTTNQATTLCYGSQWSRMGNVTTNFLLENTFVTLSVTANIFTVIGCNHYATFGPALGVYDNISRNDYSGSCLSRCFSEDHVRASCSGVGCCQTPLPENYSHFGLRGFLGGIGIELQYLEGTTVFDGCNYAFLGEKDRFNFRGAKDLKDPHLLERIIATVPVVLEWTPGYGNCRQAQSNLFTYLCQANTKCDDVDNGNYYRCSCLPGYDGNPYLEQGCTDINECDMPDICPRSETCTNTPGSYNCTCPKGWKYNGHDCFKDYATRVALVAGPSIGLGTIVLFLVVFWLSLVLRKRKQIRRKAKHFERNGGLLLQQQMTSHQGVVDKTKVFTEDELEKATDNFHKDRILGQGGQGTVYKGMLTDGRIVAIKKSKKIDESQLGQFINELVILSQINHRNIVKLLGCCMETEVPTLVYEFIQNGTLSEQIHSPNDELPFTWEMRLQIAVDSAGALAYLHSASSFPIYHRDIKTSNILLDEKYKAKVSDFGISRLVPIDDTHLTVTDAFGTFGYMDPEYLQSRMFTEKSDVYSFGVVLLELLTGKRPIQPNNNASQERMSLVAWFFTAMKHPHHDDIFDQVIRTDKREELFAVANLAKRCLDMDSKRRPTMKEVAAELEAIKAHNFSHSFEQNHSETDKHPSFQSDICEGTYGYSSSSAFNLDLSSTSVDAKPLLFDTTR